MRVRAARTNPCAETDSDQPVLGVGVVVSEVRHPEFHYSHTPPPDLHTDSDIPENYPLRHCYYLNLAQGKSLGNLRSQEMGLERLWNPSSLSAAQLEQLVGQDRFHLGQTCTQMEGDVWYSVFLECRLHLKKLLSRDSRQCPSMSCSL
jgi:hypothetical protein